MKFLILCDMRTSSFCQYFISVREWSSISASKIFTNLSLAICHWLFFKKLLMSRNDIINIITVGDTLLGSWNQFLMDLTCGVFASNEILLHFLSFIRLINKLLSAAHQHSSVDAAGHRRDGELHDVRRTSFELHTTSAGARLRYNYPTHSQGLAWKWLHHF